MKILEEYKLIIKEIKKAKNVFLIGHKNIDLDALGACIAINDILSRKKQCYTILDEESYESSVTKVMEEMSERLNIIKSKEIGNFIEKGSILIVLDTNKKILLSNPKVLDNFEKIVIIDHHTIDSDSIKSKYKIINEKASSVCEMIAEYIYTKNIKIDEQIATFLLAGIVLDTNNFVLKTTSDTYFVAFYLSVLNAKHDQVQQIMKQDLKDYIKRQKVITNIKIINENIALALCPKEIKYRNEELAKIADTILQFKGIEESYVCGTLLNNTIGISARSSGSTNIGKKLNKIGGGGTNTAGAATFENKSLKEVEVELTKLLK